MGKQKSILVMGIGNPYRCDDGIGPYIAGLLQKILPKQVQVQTHTGDGLSLIDLWKKYDCVYLIDAVFSRDTPGQIYHFDAIVESLPRNFFTNLSTHSFDILETIALAKQLDSFPEKLNVYGVEGKNFGIGSEFSEEIKQVIKFVVDFIKNDIEKHI